MSLPTVKAWCPDCDDVTLALTDVTAAVIHGDHVRGIANWRCPHCRTWQATTIKARKAELIGEVGGYSYHVTEPREARPDVGPVHKRLESDFAADLADEAVLEAAIARELQP